MIISKHTVKKQSDICKICKTRKSHGNHFGVDSCRACAAFFRRTVHSHWSQLSCQGAKCDKKSAFCKPCRLQHCFENGMVTMNFQYNRDAIFTTSTSSSIPESIETFLRQPYFIGMITQNNGATTLIDVHRLVGEISKILKLGPAFPLYSEGHSQLKKLSLSTKVGLQPSDQRKMIYKMTKTDIIGNWEYYTKKVATWLIHFEEFQKLDQDLKVELLQTVWHVWGRLEKLSNTASYRKSKEKYVESEIIFQGENVLDIMKADFDSSWFSNSPLNIVRIYMSHCSINPSDIINSIGAFEPTEMELTYMLAHLCFTYSFKRHRGGELESVSEKFLDILSNDLHNYYVNDLRQPRYFQRLAKMMQINNSIQKHMRDARVQMEIIHTFRILKLEFTHPQMFIDSGFH